MNDWSNVLRPFVPPYIARYTALSYVGGEKDYGSQETVIVNGKRFKTRENLFDFLRHAKINYSHCDIWIDTLYIDQTNVKERNHQVGLTGEIFEDAQEVVAWLRAGLPVRQEERELVVALENGTLNLAATLRTTLIPSHPTWPLAH
ncbi:uncharacterized protein Z519_03888 [Cladophialophora bantiana CBS 173.52]|uniref:Heterokaryon incompatibility domain-containing protein n=1 Tax=Cladophialophora bantiana (strain ATCC 10958 / CBS 173.52 / CDC B-1940 / NIH 8579) TaxID=1442370 RepID=A0A0D2IET9_CLAB1|nr:uncharacterized protein Z519_03888 [Cladophialophora bantiana CBS 173.52]KIW95304.1 hypothetical protein Z519_03888 [Cladophialophora bantiana CBS 173.52]